MGIIEKAVDCVDAVRNLLFAIWFIEWMSKENAKDFVNSNDSGCNSANRGNNLENEFYRFWKSKLFVLNAIYGFAGLVSIGWRLFG